MNENHLDKLILQMENEVSALKISHKRGFGATLFYYDKLTFRLSSTRFTIIITNLDNDGEFFFIPNVGWRKETDESFVGELIDDLAVGNNQVRMIYDLPSEYIGIDLVFACYASTPISIGVVND